MLDGSPKAWEAVKKEILKPLNAKIIYHISSSQWLSPRHIVHGKVRITITMNDKGEEI